MQFGMTRPIPKVFGIIGLVLLLVMLVYFLLPKTLNSITTRTPVIDVRVGLYENEPKIFTNSAGEPDGLFVDLLRAMAVEEGWALQFEACEWNHCLSLLAQGQLD